MIQNKPLTITKAHARRFLLAYHSLLPSYQLAGLTGILSYIKRVGCIQYDPLNIVGNNPELVLQSRVKDFQPGMLQTLLYKERKLLDGWDKNMSLYSVEDWPYFERFREQARLHYGHKERPATKILPLVREALHTRGPLSSRDLDFNTIVGWSWSPTRIARASLDSMYAWGELIIHHRIHTRKVYDFTVNHLPDEIYKASDPNITVEQFHDWYMERRIGSVGLLWNKSGAAWLGMWGIKSKERSESIVRLCRAGKLLEIVIEGIESPFFLRISEKALLEKTGVDEIPGSTALIIAPLDNLLWDRRFVKELFDFEYTWEVYKPVSERLYGYYVLPVFFKDRFIARFEPAYDKKNNTFHIELVVGEEY